MPVDLHDIVEAKREETHTFELQSNVFNALSTENASVVCHTGFKL